MSDRTPTPELRRAARRFAMRPLPGRRGRWFIAMWIGMAPLGLGCSEINQGPESDKRMSFSTGEFASGFKAGMSDAKWSWTDTHAARTWLWMMSEEYRQGYEQGWKDGRNKLRLEKKKQQRQREQ